ncbi:MAG: type II toxin-antitoxin system RelE/ParE family toxin [Deltaproteobacteria bacterium]|nr:type II toxin-antitoxin system RelE/ParE family toxin [Deltaproteobacteria bacterium]
MKRTFVELAAFSRRLERSRDPSLLERIQEQILQNPEAGDVIQGSGGLRKMRVADPVHKRGKSGGYRLIYMDLPHVERTYLFWFYGKNESEDISPDEKKVLKRQVELLKKEAGK